MDKMMMTMMTSVSQSLTVHRYYGSRVQDELEGEINNRRERRKLLSRSCPLLMRNEFDVAGRLSGENQEVTGCRR